MRPLSKTSPCASITQKDAVVLVIVDANEARLLLHHRLCSHHTIYTPRFYAAPWLLLPAEQASISLSCRLTPFRQTPPVGRLFAKSGKRFAYEGFQKLVNAGPPTYCHRTFDLHLHDPSKRLKRIRSARARR